MAVYQNKTPATCRRGDKTKAVSFMQFCLRRTGITVAIDGSYGPDTEKAVKSFQTARKLAVDGKCGPATWAALLNGGTALIRWRQNDPRWKDKLYTSCGNTKQTIGNSGCVPTSLAIALSACGKEVYPETMCNHALDGGWRTASSGTAWGFVTSTAPKYGRKAALLTSVNAVVDALATSKVVIASMGNGAFTTGSGHAIVLLDYDPYNKLFYVADPASMVRCCCDYATLAGQCKGRFYSVG